MTDPFTCPICGSESHSRSDKRFSWCNHCRAFVGSCALGLCSHPPAVVAGNVAVCSGHAAELGLPIPAKEPR